MSRRVIELHIEELVLRGFATEDRHAIAAAVEAELTKLLSSDTTTWEAAAGSRPSLDGGEVALSRAAGGEELGRRVAATLHASLAALAARGGV